MYLSIYLYLFVYLFIYLYIYLFIHSFIYLFIYLFMYSFIHSFIHSFIYSFIHLFIYLFIYIFIYLTVIGIHTHTFSVTGLGSLAAPAATTILVERGGEAPSPMFFLVKDRISQQYRHVDVTYGLASNELNPSVFSKL